MPEAPFDPDGLIDRLRTLTGVGRCWIAYSGGLDSRVLLEAAVRVRAHLPGPLAAVHLDHGLHPDSARWRAHCTARCAALAVPCATRCLQVRPIPGKSLEAVARAARHAAWASLLAPGELLLTAHHRDDQAETLLLALLRGSGVRGLAAMPFVAPLGPGRLVRPLLEISRAALASYAMAHGLDWIEDPSNSGTVFDRNYLRREILPRLRARWPAVSATLARSAAHCAEAALLVERLADTTLATLGGSRPGTLRITALRMLDAPQCRAVLRTWIRGLGLTPPDSAHLRRIHDEVLPARPDAAPLVAWPGCEIRRYRDDLFALPPLPPLPGAWRCALEPDAASGVLHLPCGLGQLAWRGRDRLPLGLTLAFGVTGQRCRAHPGGPNRTLKQLFQAAGIPGWLRGYVPMILADGRLITLAGVSACPASAWTWSWTGHPWETLGVFATAPG